MEAWSGELACFVNVEGATKPAELVQELAQEEAEQKDSSALDAFRYIRMHLDAFPYLGMRHTHIYAHVCTCNHMYGTCFQILTCMKHTKRRGITQSNTERLLHINDSRTSVLRPN